MAESPVEVVDKGQNHPDANAEAPANNCSLPPIVSTSGQSVNCLVEKSTMNYNEMSFNEMLSAVHLDVRTALGEAQNITTHDSNLERQYKQVVEENSKLHAQLYRARREITHLKGRLTILQLLPSEIREQKHHNLVQQKKQRTHEMQLQNRVKGKDLEQLIPLISYETRSKTVNAKGKYIDHSFSRKQHKRHRTFPFVSQLTPSSFYDKGYLPPVLPGCQCSVCNCQQSLGAISSRGTVSSFTKSGQQILLGDRVIVQGDQLGTVRYIGKLNFDVLNRIFIGVQLDSPVGITDGTVRGQQYFQCPPGHGIFVLPHDVLCVTGRKSLSSGIALPKAKIKLIPPTSGQADASVQLRAKSITPSQTGSPDVFTTAELTVNQELQKLLNEGLDVRDLVDSSVSDMAKRMTLLKARVHSSKSDNDTLKDSAVSLDEMPDSLINIPDDTMNEQDLTTLVLTTLRKKDLGQSGYVTMKELSSALSSDELQLTTNEVDGVISRLGLQDTEGQGIEYLSISPLIAKVISQLKAAT